MQTSPTPRVFSSDSTDIQNFDDFSPDGWLLASAGDDQTVRLWDPPANGAAIAVIGTDIPAESISWAISEIAVGSGDGVFMLHVMTQPT